MVCGIFAAAFVKDLPAYSIIEISSSSERENFIDGRQLQET